MKTNNSTGSNGCSVCEQGKENYSKYKLFIGLKKLGEFPTILEAKKYANKSGLSGAFNLLGENYRDSWYVSE